MNEPKEPSPEFEEFVKKMSSMMKEVNFSKYPMSIVIVESLTNDENGLYNLENFAITGNRNTTENRAIVIVSAMAITESLDEFSERIIENFTVN